MLLHTCIFTYSFGHINYSYYLFQVASDSKPVMKLDAANGVGAGRVTDLLEHVGDIMNVEVYNDGTSGELNYMVNKQTNK